MRINLNCPYDEKDIAKSLGARWDIARKVWYIVDVEDLTPFMRWIAREEPAKQSQPQKKKEHHTQTKRTHKAGIVTRSAFVPHCGCYHVLPWEDCEHTEQAAQSAMFEMLVAR